jgi:hypothetical protein
MPGHSGLVACFHSGCTRRTMGPWWVGCRVVGTALRRDDRVAVSLDGIREQVIQSKQKQSQGTC